mmetsp:Transcript_87053/g.281864  ORF Transcript_87053/g.281864 Transcript_87053/m.281864 type:complete len:210 (-) Transcript_87053:894-1523(-)
MRQRPLPFSAAQSPRRGQPTVRPTRHHRPASSSAPPRAMPLRTKAPHGALLAASALQPLPRAWRASSAPRLPKPRNATPAQPPAALRSAATLARPPRWQALHATGPQHAGTRQPRPLSASAAPAPPGPTTAQAWSPPPPAPPRGDALEPQRHCSSASRATPCRARHCALNGCWPSRPALLGRQSHSGLGPVHRTLLSTCMPQLQLGMPT